MKKLYVIAGTKREFNRFHSRVSASTLYTPVYVSKPAVLYGVRKEAYTYLHDWRRAKKLDEIQHIMAINMMVFVAATVIVPPEDEYWQDEDEWRR